MKNLMSAQDAPSTKLAEFFCTVNGRRYSMLNAKKFEANANITLSDVKRLGTMITGKKASGMEIKFSMTVYKCSEMFDNLVEEFKNTGILPVFECQVTSEDNATCMGRSTKVYKDCVIEGDILLSMFDADGEFIEQDIEGYAMDYEAPEKYTEPSYM